MAEYIIDKGVSPEVWADIEKLGKELGKLPSVGASTKDEANLAKINAQVQLLIEKQKTQQALQAKNEAAAQAAAQKTAELQEKALLKQQEVLSKITAAQQKLQIMRENNDAKNALAQKKYIDQLERQAQAAAKAVAASTPEARVSKSNTENILKLNAIAADANSTALQRMYAQMKLLEIEMQAKFNPALQQQSQEFINLNAQHAKLQAEYQRTARATGVMGRTMNSAYGSTFQLTQVMRELPNFAISARIGFMSLSNNLPMLIDSFKILKQQIIDTEGAAGATKKTFAAFGKSLLSLNTIMIVASTLLVLFGDDIIDFIGKAFKADAAINKMSESFKALLKATSDYSGSANGAIEKVTKLGIEIDKFGGDAKSADAIIKEFNSTFNTHLTTIDQVKAAYPEMAKSFIDNAIKMQAAMALITESSNAMLDVQNARLQISGFKKSDLDAAYNLGKQLEEFAKGAGYSQAEISKGIQEGTGFKDIFNNIKDLMAMDTGGGKSFEEQSYMSKFYSAYKKFEDIQGGNKIVQILGQLSKGKKEMELFRKEAEKLLQAPIIKNDDKAGDKTKRDENRDMKYQFPKSIVGEIKKIRIAPIPTFTPPINELAIAIDKNLNYAAEAYKDGSITFKEFEEFKTMQFKVAADNKIQIEGETQKMLYDLEVQGVNDIMNEIANAESEKLNKRLEIQQAFYDVSMALVDAYYQKYNDKLEKESNKQQKIEDEKLADIEDKEKTKILTKEEAENEKARITAYYDSVEEEAAKKKEELERQQFLISQAFALADIWIKYAQTVASYTAAEAAMSLSTLGLGAPAAAAIYEPLKAAALFQAGASTALIAAQSIPYFAEGGIMDKNGMAVLGDGGKKELAISPSGKFFISNDTPTMYNLEKGTQILPDVNKLDLMSILALKQVMPNMGNDKSVLNELKNVTKAIQSQKSGNFYGMPLIKQLDNRSRYSSRNKSLMN